MDEYKELYEHDAISDTEFRNEGIKSTLQYMNSHEYDILGTLGSGTFGLVVEVKRRSPPSKSSLAVKIVMEQDVFDGELNIWPKLRHPNILQFRAWRHLLTAHTYMFLTEKYPTTLKKQLDNIDFLLDPRGLDRTVNWLRGIISGLAYIHDLNLCHLDLKCNNVLISDSDDAVICDFSCLSSAEELTINYGSPLIYRAPEATSKSGVRPAVDGRKFDMWTLGLLAIEMFTGNYFYKEASQWPDVAIVYWPKQIYSAIFGILRKTTFRMLMRKTFTMSVPSNSSIDSVVSLVVSCLNLNPVERPSANELLGQKLFGGSEFCTLEESCVWFKRSTVTEIEEIIENCRTVSGRVETSEECILDETVTGPDNAVPLSKTVDVAVQTVFVSSENLAEVVESAFQKAPENRKTIRQKFVSWATKKKAKISKLFYYLKKSTF